MTATPTLILNVDDNDGARYAKTRILQSAGFKVLEAATAPTRWPWSASDNPALVLLDVKLPDINGIEVCRRIKADPDTNCVLVLQTSAALTGRADKIRGLEGGADNYLAAPIEADELIANVNALLRMRQTQDALRESEERFRQLTDNVEDVFWMFSAPDGVLAYVSPAYATIWGRSVDTLGASTPAGSMPCIRTTAAPGGTLGHAGDPAALRRRIPPDAARRRDALGARPPVRRA
jgi:CheY-like chemotaxis protein